MKLVEMIWLGQQIAKVGRQELQASTPDVPRAELIVMADLVDHAPTTITAIAQRTGYAQSRVSGAVASLAARSWVETQADPADGRRTVVVISEQTRAASRAAQQAAEGRLAALLLDGVPHDRRPAVMQALEDLLAAFRERGDPPPPFRS